MVVMETAGFTTGMWALFDVKALGGSGVGEAGESMTGEAGDSNTGEAGESIVGEAGDSTIVRTGESLMRWDEVSIINKGGESRSGDSGGAGRAESSVDFLQEG